MRRAAAVPGLVIALFALACQEVPVFIPSTQAATSGAFTSVALTQQSPIAIETALLVALPRHSDKLKFDYSPVAGVNLVNTGSPEEEATIRADVAAGTGRLRIGDGRYDLVQFHWHTPSEHTVDGVAFPLEMHLVHRSSAGELLVVGVFIAEGEPHRALAELFANLPDEHEQHALDRVNLHRLLPRSDASYRYDGSLTTSPYAEGVRWVVLAEPIELSHEQIASFQELFPHGNSRHVQPLYGRVVYTDGGPGRSN